MKPTPPATTPPVAAAPAAAPVTASALAERISAYRAARFPVQENAAPPAPAAAPLAPVLASAGDGAAAVLSALGERTAPVSRVPAASDPAPAPTPAKLAPPQVESDDNDEDDAEDEGDFEEAVENMESAMQSFKRICESGQVERVDAFLAGMCDALATIAGSAQRYDLKESLRDLAVRAMAPFEEEAEYDTEARINGAPVTEWGKEGLADVLSAQQLTVAENVLGEATVTLWDRAQMHKAVIKALGADAKDVSVPTIQMGKYTFTIEADGLGKMKIPYGKAEKEIKKRLQSVLGEMEKDLPGEVPTTVWTHVNYYPGAYDQGGKLVDPSEMMNIQVELRL